MCWNIIHLLLSQIINELGEIFGVNLSTKESVVPYAKKLQEKVRETY